MKEIKSTAVASAAAKLIIALTDDLRDDKMNQDTMSDLLRHIEGKALEQAGKTKKDPSEPDCWFTVESAKNKGCRCNHISAAEGDPMELLTLSVNAVAIMLDGLFKLGVFDRSKTDEIVKIVSDGIKEHLAVAERITPEP